MKEFSAFIFVFLTIHAFSLVSSSNAHAIDGRVLERTVKSQSLDPTASTEIELMVERRLSAIVGSLGVQKASSISKWLLSLGPDGKWPDSEVDYTTGCPARTAGWPAQDHWRRLLVMASAWHGGLSSTEQFVHNATVWAAITRGMDFWFANDFTNPACIDSGGTPSCPCGTPGLWNTNWFSNTILIPDLSSETCLLLNDTLTPTQLSNCTHITLRAYDTFTRKPTFLTGANTLDVAKVGIYQSLLTSNVSLLTDAYQRVHNEVVIQNALKADGIRADGGFGQHRGIIYNGDYGKDYAGDVLDLEVAAAGTQFAANTNAQKMFTTLFEGDSWMAYRNVLTGVNHWDFSVVGRAISLAVIDKQATASININLTEVQELGEQWDSDILVNFAEGLSQNSTNANAAKLYGNRMFYTNDYMVHRGENYITTVRMYSARTLNTECTVSQNLLGFHLSDGTVYTYLQGNEYEDIAGAWDWNLIPGTTVDYNATSLDCSHTKFTGIEAFVGGVSTGKIGIAAMRYTNPFTKSLRWQKAWFFLEDDVQHVMISGITSATDVPVLTVLDQRLHTGEVEINDIPQNQTGAFVVKDPQSLWHGDVGYVFPSFNGTFKLNVDVGEKQSDWSKIGTSKQPPSTVDLFAASIEHQNLTIPSSYTALPGVNKMAFRTKRNALPFREIQNDEHISAVYDQTHSVVMVVFWDADGGSITVHRDTSPISIASDGNAAVVIDLDLEKVTVADPSQTLRQLQIIISTEQGITPVMTTLIFNLPSDGIAGSSVSKDFEL